MIPIGIFAALVGLIGIVLLPARAQRDDPSGRNAYSTYLLLVIYIFMFVGIAGAFGFSESVATMIRNSGSSTCASQVPSSFGGSSLISPNAIVSCGSGGSYSPNQGNQALDAGARGAIAFGVLLILSFVIIFVHAHSARRLFASEETRRGPPGRVLDGYLFSTALVGTIIFAVAFVYFVISLFWSIDPGVFGMGPRGMGVQRLVSTGVVAVIADIVVWWHIRFAWKAHGKQPPRWNAVSTGATFQDESPSQ